MNAIQEAQRQGQAIWLDYIRRGLLQSGELQALSGRNVARVHLSSGRGIGKVLSALK